MVTNTEQWSAIARHKLSRMFRRSLKGQHDLLIPLHGSLAVICVEYIHQYELENWQIGTAWIMIMGGGIPDAGGPSALFAAMLKQRKAKPTEKKARTRTGKVSSQIPQRRKGREEGQGREHR